MIAEILKRDIEEFYQKTLKQNPLFIKIMDGTVSMEEVGQFITDIHYLISHTPVFLEYAEQTAKRQGQTQLAAYFAEKIQEEDGHDQWAESDLNLIKMHHKISQKKVSKSMNSLVRRLEELIGQKADYYVPYIFFAEYFTVIATPPAVTALKKNLNIDPMMLSVFIKHAEIDKHHVEFGMREIDGLYRPEELSAFRSVLTEVFIKYGEVGEEVCKTAKKVA